MADIDRIQLSLSEGMRYMSQEYPINILESPNPLDTHEVCTLVSTKKTAYYKHRYDPIPVINLMEESGYDEELIRKMFRTEPRDNCCKVISITIYSLEPSSGNYFYKNLPALVRTVRNVQKNLPDWLVRIYMDKSVYEAIDRVNYVKLGIVYDPWGQEEVDDEINSEIFEKKGKDLDYAITEYYLAGKTYDKREEPESIFDYLREKNMARLLLGSPNVEIYTLKCDSHDEKNFKMGRLRSHRFQVLFDPEVATCAIREVDGIVTNLDCHNLRVFDESNKLLYLASYAYADQRFENKTNSFNGEEVRYVENATFEISRHSEILGSRGSYSRWLNLYKNASMTISGDDFYDNNINICDLLAGVIATNVTFKDVYYHSVQDRIKNEIIQYTITGGVESAYANGFDEILLLNLYKDILSVPISKHEDRYYAKETDVQKIANLLFSVNFNTHKLLDYDSAFGGGRPQLTIKKMAEEMFQKGVINENTYHKIKNKEEYLKHPDKRLLINEHLMKLAFGDSNLDIDVMTDDKIYIGAILVLINSFDQYLDVHYDDSYLGYSNVKPYIPLIYHFEKAMTHEADEYKLEAFKEYFEILKSEKRNALENKQAGGYFDIYVNNKLMYQNIKRVSEYMK